MTEGLDEIGRSFTDRTSVRTQAYVSRKIPCAFSCYLV